MKIFSLVPAMTALLLAALADWNVRAAVLELQPGDHVALIGNALAERMQHDGHWETLLHQRFPQHRLVVRNLGWSADEVDVKTELAITEPSYSAGDKLLRSRPRSRNFGTPDAHLTHSQATVVLAFFGFNESFAGPAGGVAKFKADVEGFLTHTAKQNYSGKGAPKVVLVSPIAHENLRDPNFPDGAANNANLKLYTAALAEVAAARKVAFVDLFTPTLKLFAAGGAVKFTINGVHLNAEGQRAVGRLLDEGLFGVAGTAAEFSKALREEINEKNAQWFQRYRAVNGFYTYGGRSKLKFADGEQTNADVLERERQMLDAMTANRDVRVWKVAQGGTVPAEIDDSNAPAALPVKTFFGANRVNKSTAKGVAAQGLTSKSAEAGELKYLTSAEAVKGFKLAPGYAANCFASEEQFPEIANAVQMAFDPRGRLWVVTMASYPQYQPLRDRNAAGRSGPDDKVVILEDTDGDGRADKATIFARGLHVPTGLEFFKDGVLVAGQPDLLFLKDTDGDDRADVFERVLHGFDSADSHHAISAFTLGPGGDLYFQEGTFFYTQVETPYGPVRNHNAGVYRFEPFTWKFDTFISYGFANPWGIAFDRWGQTFISDASPGGNFFGTAFSGRTIYPAKHPKMEEWIKMRVRPTSGCEFVASRHFPAAAQGNYLLNNVIGVQGVLQHKVTDKDSGFVGTEIEPLLLSEDRNFRPVDMEFGPDGALYLVDWHEPLIGHMQYSIRDPQRDKTHGRIYRITYPALPLLKPAKIAGEPVARLLELLKEPEDRTRQRVKIELSARPAAEVIAALTKWTAALNAADAEVEHHRLEALWVHQLMNVPNEALLRELLRSQDYRARAAATRVLCYWRDRVKDPLGLLAVLVADKHPRVRLEAVRACSFFDSRKAAEIALESVNLPQDYYLKYALDETLTTLEKVK